jgi:hypothetical protein
MRIMRMYEAIQAYSGNNLFCSGFRFTKQILCRANGVFILISPHKPHVFYSVQTNEAKNMRLMRMYEDRVFKGFHLFRIFKGVRPAENMRIGLKNMRMHPHTFARSEVTMAIRGWIYATLFTFPFWLCLILAVLLWWVRG